MKIFVCCLFVTFTSQIVNSFEYHEYLFDTDRFEEIREVYPNYDEVYAPYVTNNVYYQATPNFYHQEEQYVFNEELPTIFNPEAANLFPEEAVKPTTEKAEKNEANKLPVQHDFNVQPGQSSYETSTQSNTVSASTEETSTERASEKPLYDINEAPELFKKFIKDYNKQYKDEADYNKHYENFLENLKKINKLNKEEDGTTFDINMFADLGKGESILG